MPVLQGYLTIFSKIEAGAGAVFLRAEGGAQKLPIEDLLQGH